MAAAIDYYPYDGDPDDPSVLPRRPGIDDVGGAELVDDQVYPPDKQTMPHADQLNGWQKLLVGYGKIVGVCKISLQFAGGVPSIHSIAAPSFNLEIADLTVVDNGDGDTSITWPANTFPAAACRPGGLTINSDVDVACARVIPITNGVRVKTFATVGGAGVDADCTFEVN